MPLRGKKEHSPFGYAVFRSLGVLMKKTAKFSLLFTLGMELSVRAVDAAADISGYNDQYTENEPEVITGIENAFHITIRPPRINVSFVEMREAMMGYSKLNSKLTKSDYGLVDYLGDYIENSAYSLMMNQSIADLIDAEPPAAALYGHNGICFAPFDNSKKFTKSDRINLAHETMHDYVMQINPNYENVGSLEEYMIRITVNEGMAEYIAQYVYGNISFIEQSLNVNPADFSINHLNNKLLQYIIGASFVARVLENMGPSAIPKLTAYPPSTYDDWCGPAGYARMLQMKPMPK